MSAREIQDQKAIAREMFVQQATHANADVSASPLRGATICSTKSRRDYTLESTEDEFCEAAHGSNRDQSHGLVNGKSASLQRLVGHCWRVYRANRGALLQNCL